MSKTATYYSGHEAVKELVGNREDSGFGDRFDILTKEEKYCLVGVISLFCFNQFDGYPFDDSYHLAAGDWESAWGSAEDDFPLDIPSDCCAFLEMIEKYHPCETDPNFESVSLAYEGLLKSLILCLANQLVDGEYVQEE
jgi:hypothetical protein